MADFFRSSRQSPQHEAQINSSAFVSPTRSTLLPRRFTTESGRVPTLSNCTPQQHSPNDLASQTLHKAQLIEQKRVEYEKLREQKRLFEVEMQKLDQQKRQEERELAAMQQEIGQINGHQSEPTTPPEYHDTSSVFPTIFSRPNRYSTSSITSPALFNRSGRSGSQLTSPQSAMMHSHFALDDQLPSRSVPGSRRNSEEDEKEEAVRQDPTSHRSTNALNRYSMPVTRSRPALYDFANTADPNNTAGYLFGDEDMSADSNDRGQDQLSDNLSGILRQDGFPNALSTPTVALDTAQSQSAAAETTSSHAWSRVGRHRPQQSLSTISTGPLSASGSGQSSTDLTSMGRASVRHSLDLKYLQDNASSVAENLASQSKIQTSYSTSDIPKNPAAPVSASANNHAQQHLHNHNASLGRIPTAAMHGRHTRDLSTDASKSPPRDSAATYPSIGSALQASAPPFGPASTQQQLTPTATPVNTSALPGQFPYYNGGHGLTYNASNSAAFNVPMLSMAIQGMNINGGSNNGTAVYTNASYAGYGMLYNSQVAHPQNRDSQTRVIQNRRMMDTEAMSRYQNLPLEEVSGSIYQLCKDQHGCRYLQKQLENRVPKQVHLIWLETHQHVVELMTDPFGNYLCQKLFEFCGDEERTVLIQNASQEMVRIALNQHGTRALQKMIEFISTPHQTQIIIEALRFRVVDLIQDLNGNHVIQKCLNKLDSHDAQFIFDAVGQYCVEVGTHRHGCCVLQRCIDHASGPQKMWMVQRIAENAVALVQDPFGNYVVQYIIDLDEPSFTEPMIATFRGRIGALSRHKFSSNVVEKCLRCARDQSKDMIVEELLVPGEMDRLLRDSYANYVVQTALEQATPFMKHRLIEAIRPLLPSIRSTPYGRRIQAKILSFDQRGGNAVVTPAQATPSDNNQGQVSLRSTHGRAISNHSAAMHPSAPFGNVVHTGDHSRTSSRHFPVGTGMPVASAQSQQHSHPYGPAFATSKMPTDHSDAQWL